MKSNLFTILFVLNCFISFGQDLPENITDRVFNTIDNPLITPENEAGDPMPVYMDGLWHLYTLAGNLSVIHHLTSKDLINWTEHIPAMTGGNIATGTILKNGNKYYCFYTLASKQRLQLVVSDNPWFFDRHNAIDLPGPDSRYVNDHYRDCYVFFNRTDNKWWMLAESAIPNTNPKFRSCIALLKSDDLINWTLGDPLFSPRRSWASCPQLTEAGNKWYLTYLDRSTLYRVARGPYGPFKRGERWEYNNFISDAGSRIATDGKRYFAWTWFNKRFSAEKIISGYGGPIPIGRELIFDHNTIWTRPIPEVIEAMKKTGSDEDLCSLTNTLQGKWEIDYKNKVLYCLENQGGAIEFRLGRENPNFYFECDIEVADQNMVADIIVRGVRTGYRIGVYPKQKIFEIRDSRIENVFASTTYEFEKGKPINLKIFLMNDKLEAFINDRISLSSYVLQLTTGLAIEIYDSKGVIKNPFIHYYKN
jgi:sucrose-6-phosphate hydrolase SacC (GH32 family)